MLVIRIKPQLEKVLRLVPDSLTKEIKLTQDLMELFIESQIPSDLLSYRGLVDVDSASRDVRLRAVKGHVEAMQVGEFCIVTFVLLPLCCYHFCILWQYFMAMKPIPFFDAIMIITFKP